MRLAAWDPPGNGVEGEEGTPSIQQGALDAYKQQREAAAHSALRAPGQLQASSRPEGSDDRGKVVRACLHTSEALA